MSNEISQPGNFNIAVQSVRDSTVNITQILGKSLEYKELCNELEMQRELLALLPEDKVDRRLTISQKIAEGEARIQHFKKDVLQLAEEFNRIEINTDRLRRAKAHFDNGEIAAARAVFDSEREQMQDENDRLISEKARYESDILPKLQHSADEFYFRALLERTAYDNPRWLEDTCDYFERSINAQATEDNLFQYALFLQNHNQFTKAEKHYQQYLCDYGGSDQDKRAMTLNNLAVLHRNQNELALAADEYAKALGIQRKLAAVNPSAYLSSVAMTLNNIGLLHYDQNELTLAADEYAEALDLYHKLAAVNPSAYLPYVAGTLNNLALLHFAKTELSTAEAKYSEALDLYRKLAADNPSAYLPDVAMTLNNLANLHNAKNEVATAEAEFAEALDLYRKLAAVNPSAYLPKVAMTLNNLATLHSDKNEVTTAEAEFAEALEIQRKLADDAPAAYLPTVAMTLINFATFHWRSLPNRELSIDYALEAVTILLPIVKSVPYTQPYLQAAVTVLQQGWHLSPEEIEQRLATSD